MEGEALVMRKLVVSGIVSAEKTYLTWLTILKEVSLCMYVCACLPADCAYVCMCTGVCGGYVCVCVCV